jgi:hypothetical protein
MSDFQRFWDSINLTKIRFPADQGGDRAQLPLLHFMRRLVFVGNRAARPHSHPKRYRLMYRLSTRSLPTNAIDSTRSWVVIQQSIGA